jgi:hypothetical protein
VAASFDTVSQDWLVRFLEHRIGDKRIIRLIRKWLKAGVLEDGEVKVAEEGTGQGSAISPLLANVYLHYALDLWAERWRRREARGDMIIVRSPTTPSSASSTRPTPAGSSRRCARGWRSSRLSSIRTRPAPGSQSGGWPPCGGRTQAARARQGFDKLSRRPSIFSASPSSAANRAKAASF